MGRAERRRIERAERIENRKGKLLMTRSDLGRIKKDIEDRTAKFDTEALMTCFALAEHQLYGFGPKRIMRSLQRIDDLMEGIISGEYTIQDYVDQLEDGANVKIKCSD